MALTPLDEVLGRIHAATARSGRSDGDVGLVAVSKNRSTEEVLDVYRSGQKVFGENRQQGLAARHAAGLPEDISWHFIGPLQSRKATYVRDHVDLLHSFDRLELIRRWEGSRTPVLLQFNVAGEPQKGGFDPATANEVFDKVVDSGIRVRGVMAIPPIESDPEASRPWFSLLRGVFDRLRQRSDVVDTLSMGMSSDYEVAIEEGATLVRVGTAIFGPTDHA